MDVLHANQKDKAHLDMWRCVVSGEMSKRREYNEPYRIHNGQLLLNNIADTKSQTQVLYPSSTKTNMSQQHSLAMENVEYRDLVFFPRSHVGQVWNSCVHWEREEGRTEVIAITACLFAMIAIISCLFAMIAVILCFFATITAVGFGLLIYCYVARRH